MQVFLNCWYSVLLITVVWSSGPILKNLQVSTGGHKLNSPPPPMGPATFSDICEPTRPQSSGPQSFRQAPKILPSPPLFFDSLEDSVSLHSRDHQKALLLCDFESHSKGPTLSLTTGTISCVTFMGLGRGGGGESPRSRTLEIIKN